MSDIVFTYPDDMEKELDPSWIKVSDRLPREGQAVEYYFALLGSFKGWYKSTEYGPCFYGDHGFLTDDVTHWKPREGEDDNDIGTT